MDTTTQPYQLSGRVGAAPIVMPIVALIATSLLALAYAYVCVWSPIAGYISIIFVAAFAFALAMSIGTAARLSRCRSRTFVRIVGACTGLLAIYLSWVTFIWVLFRKFPPADGFTVSLFDIATSPGAVWEMARSINVTGWYSLRNQPVTGIVLWIFWGIEALIIMFFTTFVSVASIDDEVFCEPCGAWCTGKQAISLSMPLDEEGVRQLATGAIGPIEALPPVAPGTIPQVQIQIRECATCDRTATYQVLMVAPPSDPKRGSTPQTIPLTAIIEGAPATIARLEAIATAHAEEDDGRWRAESDSNVDDLA